MMARDTIFQSTAAHDSDYERGCCKTSQDSNESREARLPGERKNPEAAVRSVERPHRGKHY